MDATVPLDPRKAIRPTLMAASFGYALVQLDVTIVNVALPDIGADLGTDVAGLQWVVDAYALVFAALLLTAGHLGDLFGAKRIYVGGLALFAAASLGCGLAGSVGALIVGRIVQGIGAAAMMPASLTLLNHAIGDARRWRAWAIGWWTAAATSAVASGPVLGGLIVGAASWRWIFLVNLPISAIGAALTLRVAETKPAARAGGLDATGQVLGIVALVGLVGAVIEAKPRGLLYPLVIGSFAVGLAAAWAFVRAEMRSSTPMLPPSLFRVPGFAICVAYGAVANIAYFGLLFVLTLYLQVALGFDATATGWSYVPLTATFFIGNFCNAPIVGRFGSRRPMVVGYLVTACGFAMLLALDARSSFAAMLLPFVVIPIGMGTGVPAMLTHVLASIDRAQSGIATAVVNCARQAGGALGVALFGALAGDTPAHVVAGLHASAVIAAALMAGMAALAAFGLRDRAG